MNEKFKTILIICGIAFFLWLLHGNEQSKIDDNIYESEIRKYNYTICGIDYSIYDYLYEDQLDINQLLDNISDECNY